MKLGVLFNIPWTKVLWHGFTKWKPRVGWPSDYWKFKERDCLLEGCNEPCIFYDLFGVVEPIIGPRNCSIPTWNKITSVQVWFVFAEQVQHEIFQAKQDSLPLRS